MFKWTFILATTWTCVLSAPAFGDAPGAHDGGGADKTCGPNQFAQGYENGDCSHVKGVGPKNRAVKGIAEDIAAEQNATAAGITADEILNDPVTNCIIRDRVFSCGGDHGSQWNNNVLSIYNGRHHDQETEARAGGDPCANCAARDRAFDDLHQILQALRDNLAAQGNQIQDINNRLNDLAAKVGQPPPPPVPPVQPAVPPPPPPPVVPPNHGLNDFFGEQNPMRQMMMMMMLMNMMQSMGQNPMAAGMPFGMGMGMNPYGYNPAMMPPYFAQSPAFLRPATPIGGMGFGGGLYSNGSIGGVPSFVGNLGGGSFSPQYPIFSQGTGMGGGGAPAILPYR